VRKRSGCRRGRTTALALMRATRAATQSVIFRGIGSYGKAPRRDASGRDVLMLCSGSGGKDSIATSVGSSVRGAFASTPARTTAGRATTTSSPSSRWSRAGPAAYVELGNLVVRGQRLQVGLTVVRPSAARRARRRPRGLCSKDTNRRERDSRSLTRSATDVAGCVEGKGASGDPRPRKRSPTLPRCTDDRADGGYASCRPRRRARKGPGDIGSTSESKQDRSGSGTRVPKPASPTGTSFMRNAFFLLGFGKPGPDGTDTWRRNANVAMGNWRATAFTPPCSPSRVPAAQNRQFHAEQTSRP